MIKANTASFRVPSGTAPGYRYHSTGVLHDISYIGFSYSSAIKGISGVYLNFHMAWVGPGNTGGRGYGFQLRCLSE